VYLGWRDGLALVQVVSCALVFCGVAVARLGFSSSGLAAGFYLRTPKKRASNNRPKNMNEKHAWLKQRARWPGDVRWNY
jgi:hypothetical protein